MVPATAPMAATRSENEEASRCAIIAPFECPAM